MFSRSIRKTIRQHLHASEQLLAAVLAQNAGANTALMVSALRGPIATARAHERAHRAHDRGVEAAGDAGVAVDRRMVIAVTAQRLLVFKSGGAFTAKATGLLADAPIADVDGSTSTATASSPRPSRSGSAAPRSASRPPAASAPKPSPMRSRTPAPPPILLRTTTERHTRTKE